MSRREIAMTTAATALVVLAGGCGPSGETAVETLPPIRTTTSSSTTTTTASTDRLFYTIKPGESLAIIANSFQVPLQELIKLNTAILPNPDNVPVGITLEIPTGIQLVDTLPTPQTTAEP